VGDARSEEEDDLGDVRSAERDPNEHGRDGIMKRVGEVMSTPAVTMNSNDVIGDVRDQLLDTGIHCVPVVNEDGHPVGIVSSWDLVEEYQPFESIANAMTDRIEMIGPHASLQEAAIAMRENFIHHLVVVDEAMNVVGVVSSLDLLDELAGV
ncbi:MAG: CBS domain-containing protein, partial [Acidimicrobiia bacterium]|nr:CBS domain-containing protein [Acidimicrobiia bacterium]